MKLTVVASTLLMCCFVQARPLLDEQESIAPLYVPANVETVNNAYIVVLKNHLVSQELQAHAEWIEALVSSNQKDYHEWLNEAWDAHGIDHVYDTPHIKGYSGRFDEGMLAAIRESDDVDYVEKDSLVFANELQRNAPWGLARVSHKKKLSFKNYKEYEHDPEGGEGVKVYVIDTGINVDHVDFEGRAIWGHTVPRGDVDEDGNGHGSHCAGTIAGKRYGIAKKAHPVAVKVLRSNGSGSMSDVIKGVDWATSEHVREKKAAETTRQKYKGAVANMSLGGGPSPSLDRFVNGAVREGIVFSVAAGNENADACYSSPAAAELAITVGASNLQDRRAYFSNYGECVDVFAPGQDIESVWRGNKYATNTISGTSMAAPHVAGLAAYLLSLEKEPVTAKEIKDKILSTASKGLLSNIPPKTPNLLINIAPATNDDRLWPGFDHVLKDFFGDI
ncbi:serine protease 1 [Sporodiniella umbellata]|nr:serine protease 1 [Sporodiniella umbellata]